MNKNEMPVNETLSSQPIMDIVSAYQKSRLVLTAYELDVFTALGDGKKTSSEVAKKIKTDPRATDRLMNALCAIGLLEKKEGRFANTPITNRFLVKGKPDYMANLMHSANQWKTWSTLTDAVRQGTSVVARQINDRGDKWLDAFISAMHHHGRLQASELISKIDLSGVRRILDVGGGSGAYAMAFVRAKEEIEAVVFDLPNVIPITKRYIKEAGLADKIKTVAGDYNEDALGRGYDLVFISAILHINSSSGNIELLRKASSALNPGGRVVVSDFIVDEDRTGPARGALFALNMLVSTEAGDTYTESEVRAWMKETGFFEVTRRETGPGMSLIIGRKS